MNGLIGGFIFIYVGVFIKWFYFQTISLVTQQKPKTFKQIYAGEEDLNDYGIIMNSISNQAVGVIFIMSLVALILFLNV